MWNPVATLNCGAPSGKHARLPLAHPKIVLDTTSVKFTPGWIRREPDQLLSHFSANLNLKTSTSLKYPQR